MAPLSLLLALHTAHAANVRVSDVGSLQAAASALNDGDTLIVDTYSAGEGVVTIAVGGALTIRGDTQCGGVTCPWGWGAGTSVVIVGDGGPDVVTIRDIFVSDNGDVDGDGQVDSTIHIMDKNAELLRVGIVGNENAPNVVGRGSGLTWTADDDQLITIDDILVQGNAGPGVYLFGGDAEIYNSDFIGNGNEYAIFANSIAVGQQEIFYGAGLHFDGDRLVLGEAYLSDPADPASEVVKRGNTFRDNVAVYGGGAYIRANEGQIDGNSFEYNVANDYSRYNEVIEINTSGGVGVTFSGEGLGGGLYVEDGGFTDTLYVRWNQIASNWAWDAAGVHFQDAYDVEFSNNLVAQNWAVHLGGGLSMVQEDSDTRPVVHNNTLVGNVAGLTRVLLAVQVVGGGGNARIDGVIPDFRNNVITHAPYGGGILGVTGDGPFEPGDDFNTWFRYNMFYSNCDVVQCTPNDSGDIELTGNYRQYALHPSNLVETEPDYIYFGDPREPAVISDNDAYPDVFCLTSSSPGLRAGDPDLPNLGDSSYASDVGHCGGVECFYWNRDRDQDGWLQHQDCLDDPTATFPGRPQPNEVNPDATEACDYEDNDCDGFIDEGFVNKWWPDADGDGGGALQDPGVLACQQADLPNGGANYVDNNLDCDDGDPLRSGSLPEICDAIDNDCDGIVNEAEDVSSSWMYPDQDGDQYGEQAEALSEFVCQDDLGQFYLATDVDAETAPDGAAPFPYLFTFDNSDCNDRDASFSPAAFEVCDELDHNCNGDAYDVQEGDFYYLDSDADGWGDVNTKIALCDGQPLPDEGAWVANAGDCDETNPLINNGAQETCDSIDNNCNGIIDDNPADGLLLYEDFDNDGFGNPATALRACTHPSTYTASVGGDCDDADPNVGECSECGCQATPTPGSMGLLTGGLLALLGLRRRRP